MANRRLTRAALLFLATTAFVGCSGAESISPTASPAPYGERSSRAIVGGAEIEALVVESNALVGADGASPGLDRQIIREGRAIVEVDDLASAEEALVAMIPDAGFVESSDRSDDYVRLVMRIPSTGFESFIDALDDVGDVENVAVSGRDVTEQLIDWQARLDNLIALRDRLRLHMDRATNVEELVLVERELARVQSEIDSLSGRLDSTRDAVALSRLTVTLREGTRLGPLGVLFYGIGKAISWLFVRD